MTRSIFDPTGPDTERSGSRNSGPDAQNISHMPARATDGEAETDEQASGPKEIHDQVPGQAVDANEAAKRLAEMTDPEAPVSE